MAEARTAIGTRVVVLATIGSTNSEALARAEQGEAGPLWITAERQTAGVGRRGRSWYSEPGNLHATLLLDAGAPSGALAELCFVAAVALHDALIDTCLGMAPADLRLKWPNDVLLMGGKVAGILIQSRPVGGRHAAAIGFGVNCSRRPPSTEFPAIDLAGAGFAVAPATLLDALDIAMLRRLDEWDRGGNFAAVRAAWLLRATGLGAPIEVRLPERTVDGVFETVDDEGSLILRRDDGSRESIRAGDIFPLTGNA